MLWQTMWRSGRWDEGMELHGATLPVLPFYSLVFPFDMREVRACCRAWSERFGKNAALESLPYPLTNHFYESLGSTRTLRVGYISSDVYRVHPVGKSVDALLRAHDPARVEVVVFLLLADQVDAASQLEDGTGGVLLADLSVLSSAEGAAAINDEAIHVLIDLNGHTSGVRMEMLAYRPAPISMHYMGFGATLDAPFIDYFLADAAASAPPWLRQRPVLKHLRLTHA